jgi:hypothetical protein
VQQRLLGQLHVVRVALQSCPSESAADPLNHSNVSSCHITFTVSIIATLSWVEPER